MPKTLHNKILKDVKKAHPGYSTGRAEQETNAVLANIGKKKAGKRVRKSVKRGKKK